MINRAFSETAALVTKNDVQSRQRFPFFAAASLFAVLIMTGFGIYNALAESVLFAVPSFITAAIIAALALIAFRIRRRQVLYFGGLLIAVIYLLYLFSRGGANGSLSFWFLSLPLISFLLLGKRLGAIMSLLGLLGVMLIFTKPEWVVREEQSFSSQWLWSDM